ncbi:MAG: hypothetical protein NPINA01_02850 [Nitrospinaceae bacterium]|nr:MAG: hypothetical protein NPINA01_02850 [Nitrospinaceae bacterium]
MNIFVLDKDLKKAAQYHCDQHVVKMILEYAQILCTVCNLNGTPAPYKVTHAKHPCVLWAGSSLANWRWLKKLALELNEEYKFRFDKIDDHKSAQVISELQEPGIADEGLTEFVQTMPEQYINKQSAVKGYRAYYINEKVKFATWKKRKVPEWFSNSL